MGPTYIQLLVHISTSGQRLWSNILVERSLILNPEKSTHNFPTLFISAASLILTKSPFIMALHVTKLSLLNIYKVVCLSTVMVLLALGVAFIFSTLLLWPCAKLRYV